MVMKMTDVQSHKTTTGLAYKCTKADFSYGTEKKRSKKVFPDKKISDNNDATWLL